MVDFSQAGLVAWLLMAMAMGVALGKLRTMPLLGWPVTRCAYQL